MSLCRVCGAARDVLPAEALPERLRGASTIGIPEAARPEVPPLPQDSRRTVRWEIAAVLCIGVLPYLWGSIEILLAGSWASESFTRQSIGQICSGIFISVPVLYLIARSSESRAGFGIQKFRRRDLLIGLGFYAIASLPVSNVIGPILSTALPQSTLDWQQERLARLFPVPASVADFALLAPSALATGFSEELVMRAYLITRLQQLWQSSFKAVLVSALVFASYHTYQGYVAVTDHLPWALLMGLLFVATRRLWPLAIAHSVNNLVVDLLRASS